MRFHSFLMTTEELLQKIGGSNESWGFQTYQTIRNLWWPPHFIGLLSVILYASENICIIRFWFLSTLTKVCNGTETIKKESPAYWTRDCDEKTIVFKKFQTFPIKSRYKRFYWEIEEGNQSNKVESETAVRKNLKERTIIDQNTVVELNGNFSGITLDMIKNRYIVSTGIQDIADTVTKSRSFLSSELNFDSPRVYEYIRGVFALPNTNSLTEWPFQMNFEPGFFMHVFRSLKPRIF